MPVTTLAPSKQLLYSVLSAVLIASTLASVAAVPNQDQAKLAKAYGKLPLSFEANHGQTDPSVRFLSRGSGYSLYLTDSAAVLALGKPSKAGASKADAIRMTLTGGSKTSLTQVAGEEPLAGKVNYFLGNDPAKWHSNIPTYAKVRYASVYPGIDLVYYGNQHQLEYDFIVAPNADPESIKLHFTGAQKLSLTPTGDLTIQSENGAIAFRKPEIYQQTGGSRTQIRGNFKLLAGRTVRFEVGKYDHTRPLTIDPTLSYSTYLGGSNSDQATAIAVDASGDAFIAGYTNSVDFPTTSASFQPAKPLAQTIYTSAFLSKLNPSGTALIYSTYVGGTTFASQEPEGYYGDQALGVAVDSSGSAYLTGIALTSNFPVTEGAFQTKNKETQNGSCFVTKLNPAGSALAYSTLLGGSGLVISGPDPGFGDACHAIQVDSSGNAYVGGFTSSRDFPVTPGALQSTNNEPIPAGSLSVTGFVSKFNPTGTALVYSTYLGGSKEKIFPSESVTGIAVDTSGDAFVAGYTAATDFPVTGGAFQTVQNGGENAFVAKLNPAGSSLDYATYLGGTGASATGIAIDSSGNAYVTGYATYGGNQGSPEFPVTSGAFQTVFKGDYLVNGSNAFITKFNPTGTALVYSTWLGGGYSDLAKSIVVDSSGSAIVTGTTESTNFPVTKGAFQTAVYPPLSYQGSVALTPFVTKLNPAGSALVYSTYFGQSQGYSGNTGNIASGNAVAVDGSGDVYFAGQTSIWNFPVSSGAFQTTYRGAQNATFEGTPGTAYAAKLALGLGAPDASGTATTLTASNLSRYFGQTVTFTAKVVSSDSTTVIPTGQVTFLVDGAAVSTATLDSTGQAQYQTASIPVGGHSIVANYSGSDTLDLSTYLLDYDINPNTNVTLKVVPQGGVQAVGIPVTFTATVTPFGTTTVPTGSVTFVATQGSGTGATTMNLGTVNLNPSGSANLTTSSLPYGFWNITASYNGSPTFSAGSASLTENIVSPSMTVVGTTGRYSTYGTPFAPLIVQVQGPGGNSQPLAGETVTFSGSGLNFSSKSPVTAANGEAQVIAMPTQAGNLSATASIAGSTQQIIFNLTTGKAILHVGAKSVTSLYGQTPAQPTGYNLEGFVLGDTASVVSGAPVLSTSVTATTPIGSYPIAVQVGTLTATNYSFSNVSNGEGVLTVVRAPLYISAKSITTTYGQAPAQPTAYTLTGFVNGETASVVSGAPTLSTTVTATTPAGTYPIKVGVGTLSAANYSFSTQASGEGAVQVAKAPLTIHPASFTINAGDPLPTFTYTITGFVNGDTQAASTTGTPALTTTAPNNTTPGRYYIIANPGTFAAKNYALTQPSAATNGILTILAN